MLILHYYLYICRANIIKVISYNKEITASFTGHRTYNGSRNEELKAAIRALYERGYRYFLSGMAIGFDLEAAKAVLSLRNELKGIRLVAVIPFEGMQIRFPASERSCFDRVCREADEIIYLAPKYSVTAYTIRNNFLVDNASAIIAYFDGSKGGTAYTIRRSVKSLVSIINIYNNPQQELFR